MSVIGKLHTVEHESWEAARQGFSRARISLEEAQSQIRRKMRIHPRSAKPQVPVFVPLQERKRKAAPPRVLSP
jgi:hypothetical protein